MLASCSGKGERSDNDQSVNFPFFLSDGHDPKKLENKGRSRRCSKRVVTYQVLRYLALELQCQKQPSVKSFDGGATSG